MQLPGKIKEYFHFSKGEKRGILTLTIILLGIYTLPYTIKNRGEEKWEQNNNKTEINKLVQQIKKAQADASNKNYNKPQKNNTLFTFNPNTIDSINLIKLGLSQRQTQNLLKYREKGGKIRKKEDLLKLYTIDKKYYEKLKPYIKIDNTAEKQTKPYTKKIIQKKPFIFDPNTLSDAGWDSLGITPKTIKTIRNYLKTGAKITKKEDLKKIYGFPKTKYTQLEPYIKIKQPKKTTKKLIEINTADTTQLKQLQGIGSILSKRIIKYRKTLGGFVNKNQLSEIYGLNQKTLKRILPLITVDSAKITKININKADAKMLTKHPYITYKQATDIERYRKKNGAIPTTQTIQKIKLLPDSTYKKIKPYLKTTQN